MIRFAVVFVLWATPASACHRFSIWKYPTPQRCAVIHVAKLVLPLKRDPNILLPSMSKIEWGTDADDEMKARILLRAAMER